MLQYHLLLLLLLLCNTWIQAREYRTFNGTGNNILQPLQGSIQQPALLSLPGNYTLLNTNLPGARQISNMLFSRPHRSDTLRQTADLHTQYGWFIMLDICGLEFNAANITLDIPVPADDPYFHSPLRFRRWSSASNQYDSDSAQYLNYNTAYLDLSPVYGYNNTLRTWTNGQLNESLLYDTGWEIPLQGAWFMSGDSRTNMLPMITVIVKIWIRYHNSLAVKLLLENPLWSDEILFQEARRWCIAVHQKISTREWLAALLGGPLAAYKGYKSTMHAQVSLLFAVAAAAPFGYSQIHPFVSRRTMNNQAFHPEDAGTTDGATEDTDLPLHQCLYRPVVGAKLNQATHMDAIITGSIYQVQGMLEARAIDTIRNTPLNGNTVTFAPSNDLIALTIQRGRDVGLPKYNQVLKSMAQPFHLSFNTISSDPNIVSILQSLYAHVDDIDLYVGMAVEDRQPNAAVGNLLRRVMRAQLQTLRDGDRFWYENPTYFTQNETDEVYAVKWSWLLKQFTTFLPNNLPDNVFYVPGGGATSTASIVSSPRLSLPAQTTNYLSGQIRPAPNYVLSWIIYIALNQITIQVDCMNGGWVGVGWGNQQNTMKGADIALMTLDPITGVATIRDSYALDVGMPQADTNLVGGTDDLFDKSGVFDPITSVHTFKFSRLLTTSDLYDNTLDIGQGSFIFAFHPTIRTPTYHGPNRSPFKLNMWTQSEQALAQKLRHVSESPTMQLTFLIITCVLMLVAFIALLLTYLHRHHVRIRAATSLFVHLISVGVFTGYGAALIATLPRTDFTCMFQFWLIGCSWILVQVPILLKTWRIFRIFVIGAKRLRVLEYLSTKHLSGLFGIFFVAELVLLIVWTVLAPMRAQYYRAEDSNSSTLECTSSITEIPLAVFVAYKAVFLILGLLLVIRGRGAGPKLYNELPALSADISVNLCLAIIAITLGYLLRHSFEASIVITWITLIGSNTYVLSNQVLSKLHHILILKESSVAPAIMAEMENNNNRSNNNNNNNNNTMNNNFVSPRLVTTAYNNNNNYQQPHRVSIPLNSGES